MNFSDLRQQLQGTALESLSPFLDEKFLGEIRHGDFPRWRQRLAELPAINPSQFKPGDAIQIGRASDAEPARIAELETRLREFIPWRKGPFELFGIEIDTEWRCNLKWDRLKDQIQPLAGKTVLDVGCGNGYFACRMLEEGADLVIGIDPHIAYVAQFWAIKHFVPALPVHVLPLTLEQFPKSSAVFDSVFSMGVLYHRRSPIDHLHELKSCLKPGGQLILESIVVEGEAGYSLTPDKKYARMSNVWFVPSIATICQWLKRCGFCDIDVIDESVTILDEQRKTDWMPFDSLDDALDTEDPKLTIEGYPAPKRAVIVASRPL